MSLVLTVQLDSSGKLKIVVENRSDVSVSIREFEPNENLDCRLARAGDKVGFPLFPAGSYVAGKLVQIARGGKYSEEFEATIDHLAYDEIFCSYSLRAGSDPSVWKGTVETERMKLTR